MNMNQTNDESHNAAYERTGFWGKRAAGCIVYATSTNQFLIAQRSQSVLAPNTWGTWGGAIDQDEEPEDAALRELYEEGANLDQPLVDVIPSYVFKHSSGFEYHNFIVVVEHEFEPELTEETQEYMWTTLDNLPANLNSGLKEFLFSPEAQQQLATLDAQEQKAKIKGPRM